MFLSALAGKFMRGAKTLSTYIKLGVQARHVPVEYTDSEIEEDLEEDEVFIEDKNIAVRVKDDIDVQSVEINDDASDEEQALSLKSVQEGAFENDNVTDNAIFNKYSDSDPLKDSTPKSGWDYEVLPAGASSGGEKPNMRAIAVWVRDTKLGDMTTDMKKSEYVKVHGGNNLPSTWDKKMEDKLVDTISFLVARKIWYVGRRSDKDDDDSWQEKTADKRPSQGTFSKNEHWANGFPYTQEYSYKSWGKEESMQLKTTGKLSW